MQYPGHSGWTWQWSQLSPDHPGPQIHSFGCVQKPFWRLQPSLHLGQSQSGPSHPGSHWQVNGLSLHEPCWHPGNFWHMSQNSPVQPFSHLCVKYIWVRIININHKYMKNYRFSSTLSNFSIFLKNCYCTIS